MPFIESQNVDHPISLYYKKANELMAHSYSHLFDIPTTGLRFLLYMVPGAGQIWHYSYLQKYNQ